MLNSHTRCVLSLPLALLLAGGAWAQTPAAPRQLDVATTGDSQFLVSTALDGQGNVTLLWTQLFAEGSFFELARGRRFSRGDVPLGPDIVFEKTTSISEEVVANARGDYLAIWNRRRAGGATQGVLRRVSPVLRTLTLRFRHPLHDVAVDQAGNFVVVWTTEAVDSRLLGQRYNADGTRRGPEFEIAASRGGFLSAPQVAMNHRTGEFVVVWVKSDPAASNRRIFAHRFGFATGRQGSEFQVTSRTYEVGHRLFVDVGRAEDGSFVVAWSSHLQFAEPSTDIFAQRFTNTGAKSGGEIVIAEDTPITDGYMRLAVGPQGQFVAAWDDGGPPLFMRAYRPDGSPVGPARQPPLSIFPGGPEPAFGFDGTFVLGWTDFIGIHDPNEDNWEINYQRFAAAPGVELCLFRNGHFRCDTNAGGAAEIDYRFPLPGGTPLLGDADGDGRDDYCYRDATRFLCDTEHFGADGEIVAVFGQPGDTPLLGDVDGDGRDEPCVFRSDRFLCDTAWDGGAAEVEIAFGQPGDRALLGDLDGDGHVDPCVFRGGEFLCDTAHNGGAAEVVIAFDIPGAVPLLGDLDGDGRDDPCQFRAGSFACDTAHDGGAAERTLTVTVPGRPLIGNVDGV